MLEWWFYIVAIFAAAFLVNGIPHFTNGISGRQFTTPFSGGPGTLDTAVRNVLWGSANFIVGGVLLWLIRSGLNDLLLIVELVAAAVGFAVLLGMAFANPERFAWRR